MTGNGSNRRLNGLWLAFSPDTPERQAMARFTEKYGYPLCEIHRSGGLLLVGPIDRTTRTDLPNPGRFPHSGGRSAR